MHVTDEPDAVLDDDSHYVSSFSWFMKRVRPLYAIPFASNNCFLHKDVIGMNRFAQAPLIVKTYFESFASRERLTTRLVIMVAGDKWSSGRGFDLGGTDWFENREQRLAEYAESVQPTLAAYYALEERTRVSLELMQRLFRKLWKTLPFFLKRGLPGAHILIVSYNTVNRDYYAIDLSSGEVSLVADDDAGRYEVRAEFPAIILAQSRRMNMFSQAWISKRVHYYATRASMPILHKFLRILGFNEAELLPLRTTLSRRTMRSFLPRWRECFLYAHVMWHLMQKRDFLDIETRLLRT